MCVCARSSNVWCRKCITMNSFHVIISSLNYIHNEKHDRSCLYIWSDSADEVEKSRNSSDACRAVASLFSRSSEQVNTDTWKQVNWMHLKQNKTKLFSTQQMQHFHLLNALDLTYCCSNQAPMQQWSQHISHHSIFFLHIIKIVIV